MLSEPAPQLQQQPKSWRKDPVVIEQFTARDTEGGNQGANEVTVPHWSEELPPLPYRS